MENTKLLKIGEVGVGVGWKDATNCTYKRQLAIDTQTSIPPLHSPNPAPGAKDTKIRRVLRKFGIYAFEQIG